MTPIVYLHGFGSSPLSTKARYFERRFAQRGNAIQLPELDAGDFEKLTITGQLKILERSVNGNPAILVGSSLGGYLAALYASRHSNIERLILLAPALQFPSRWRRRFAASELERWKQQGALKFYHYGHKEERALGYQFVTDALQYPEEPDCRQPMLILHGRYDNVVPVEISQQYAAHHPNVMLRVVESGHELTDVLDRLWAETITFLGFQKP